MYGGASVREKCERERTRERENESEKEHAREREREREARKREKDIVRADRKWSRGQAEMRTREGGNWKNTKTDLQKCTQQHINFAT